MSANPKGFIGQEHAWTEWMAAINSQRMHHAWLLAGAKGLGKGIFALAAAAELVRTPGGKLPDPARHPDILVLDHLPKDDKEARKKASGEAFETKRNITIAQIRSMQQRLTTRPTLGERRAIIIEPADDMERGAVNALLKSLEEPPVGTYFLLVAHQPGRLLATIRSRCRNLRFAALTSDELDAVLLRDMPEADSETRAAAIEAAHGSPGIALNFIEHNLAAIHQLMAQILDQGDDRFTLRGELAGAMGARPARARIFAVLDLARAELAAKLARAPRHGQLPIIEAHGTLARLAAQAPTYNFDPGLLIMEIGGLLASAAMPRETADQRS
ncbi:MAG: DNA polymerase III subunit delta' [Novosphingobium sp.]|nr:DNA polymerase III subunit delta' [Novosphingobium sp.]